MSLSFKPPDPRTAASGEGRREFGRRRQEQLLSNLGPVLDLSRGGMKVLATRAHRGRRRVLLFTAEGNIPLAANVAWSRRLGFRRHELGMEFLDVDSHTARVLMAAATAHALILSSVA